MKTIVALVDFSDVTFKVLKQAHTLAAAFGSQVVILHVVPPEPVVLDFGVAPTVMREPSAETVQAEGLRLQELEESLTKHGVQATSRQIHGTTLDSLLEECDKSSPDLIIVGSHRHGAFYNLVVGSITAGVLKSAKCPVLVVPTQE
jgi:nucleotide-binding universal stress UspA family protein